LQVGRFARILSRLKVDLFNVLFTVRDWDSMSLRNSMFSNAWVLLLVVGWTPLSAQQRASQRRVANPGESQFQVDFLRPSGGAVIPIFEGWYQNPDGTYELSFGYFNVNTEEVIDIALGTANFIDPREFDGVQPTHFQPLPDGERRHVGVFTVTVPEDWGSRDVVWTLQANGQTLSVPGRLTSTAYQLNGWFFPGRNSASPLLRLESSGFQGRGPAGVTAGPLRAQVGEPLELTVWTSRDQELEDSERPIRLRWFEHQAPGSGEVMFTNSEIEVPAEDWMSEGGAPASTEATFDEVGEYVLRVMAYNRWSEFEYQCCWTNGFVRVTVER
jgi:hypothetical protein